MKLLFDIVFYCSSKYSSKGYNPARLTSENEMVVASFPKAISSFVYLRSIGFVLLKANKQYYILIMNIEQPDDFKERAVDISGAKINISLSISAPQKNEKEIRRLFYKIYSDYAEFSNMIYKAYNFCEKTEIGYSFNSDIINAYIENCLSTVGETASLSILDTKERFIACDFGEIKALLGNKLPSNDGVFFAELKISENSFKNWFEENEFPYYIFDEEYRKR